MLVGISSASLSQEATLDTTTATTVPKETPLTAAVIEEQQKQIDAAELDDEAKKQIAELYRQAIEQAKKTETLTKQLAGFLAAKDSASTRADELKEKAKKQKEAPIAKVAPSETLADLEQRLSRVDQTVKDLKTALVKAEGETAARSTRRKTIRDRLVEAKKQLESASKQAETPAASEDSALNSAKKAELKTQLQLLRVEIPALEAELAALDAEDVVDLPRLNRDFTAQELARAEEELKLVQAEVTKKRSLEATQQIAEAKRDAERKTNPTLRVLAERNVALAEQYKTLTQAIADAKKKLTDVRTLREYWDDQATSAKEKVESIGLTDTIGGMLRKQKLSLPSASTFLVSISNRTEKINEAQLQLLEREEERTSDLDETLRQQFPDIQLSGEVRDEAETLLTKRNELLSPLVRSQSTYYDTLVDISNTEQRIANQINDYSDFIDERVLWVRSGPPLWKNPPPEKSDLWLLDRARWQAAGNSLLVDISTGVASYAAAGLFLVFLLRNRLTLRRRLKDYGALAESGSCTDFTPTIATVLTTALAALPWPALFAFMSWRLSRIAGGNEALRALAHGCFSVAVGYYPLEFFRLVCKPHGLAEAHLGWPSAPVQLVRRSLRAMMLIGLPLVLLTAMLSSSTSGLGKDTFERLTFGGVTVALSFFLSRILSSKKGAFSGYLALYANSWVSRLQPIWYWLFVLSPLALTGLTVSGYHYTAQQLAWRLYSTACLLGVVLIATAFISRLLLVQRRRLSIEQAKQRRAAQLKASQDETAAVVAEELPSAEDLREQISQSQSLLRTVMVGVALVGIWIAWVDVLPALGFLEQWPLWDSTQQVSEMVEDDAGDVTFKTREILDPVTIADVVLSLLILGLTFVSARNVPGVLEISVLQRLPIEASVRYAITTMVSYGIVVVGLIVACSMIGIHWNQVQWMATALTFGLAFGLQEMFANFVAGIIILFERPIRVGDIVTIDDISGTVSRVQIRATTITNWDRKDYIVPNKDFITGRVLNWTLSDQVNRIVINVGVAYGSDTQSTIDTLTRVTCVHPMVVEDPAPIVTFEEFGGSSLNFVVRCFIAMKDMPSRLQVIHELHKAIDDAFREAHIEIAFPQQDLHIRTVPKDQKFLISESNGHAKRSEMKKKFEGGDESN